jgi:hypothetical protein
MLESFPDLSWWPISTTRSEVWRAAKQAQYLYLGRSCGLPQIQRHVRLPRGPCSRFPEIHTYLPMDRCVSRRFEILSPRQPNGPLESCHIWTPFHSRRSIDHKGWSVLHISPTTFNDEWFTLFVSSFNSTFLYIYARMHLLRETRNEEV